MSGLLRVSLQAPLFRIRAVVGSILNASISFVYCRVDEHHSIKLHFLYSRPHTSIRPCSLGQDTAPRLEFDLLMSTANIPSTQQ